MTTRQPRSTFVSAYDINLDHRIASTDEALRGWRETSERRRTAYAKKRVVQHQDRVLRRKIVLLFAVAIVASTAGSGTAYGLFAEGAPEITIQSVSQFAPPPVRSNPPVEVARTMLPVATNMVMATAVTKPIQAPVVPKALTVSPTTVRVPSTPSVALESLTPAVSFDAGIAPGSVRVWTAAETEWVMFDFMGDSPLDLRWLDGSQSEVLDRMTCTNVIEPGLRRCYVGRTHRRIQFAMDQGAVAGVWQVDTCAVGTQQCTMVGRFDVSG